MDIQTAERVGGKEYPLRIIRQSETETVFISPMGESRCRTRAGDGHRQLKEAAARALTEQRLW